MYSFFRTLRFFLAEEKGPTAVEYAVMLALIVVVCMAAITSIGNSASSVFSIALTRSTDGDQSRPCDQAGHAAILCPGWEEPVSGQIMLQIPSRQAIADYYDGVVEKGLADFVFGNARVSAAIDRCCSVIGPNVQNVLDIGCGIGISSYEFHRRHPRLSVLGSISVPNALPLHTSCLPVRASGSKVSAAVEVPSGTPFNLVAP